MFQIFKWLVTSSNDPERVSLLFRGMALMIVPAVMTLAPIACTAVAVMCFDTTLLHPMIEALTKFIKDALILVSDAMIIFGLARKAYLGKWSAYKTS